MRNLFLLFLISFFNPIVFGTEPLQEENTNISESLIIERIPELDPSLENTKIIFKYFFSSTSPYLSIFFQNLAFYYDSTQKYMEANYIYRIGLYELENKIGVDHETLIPYLNHFATYHTSHGNYMQAELLLNRSLTIGTRKLAPNHPDLIKTIEIFSQLYMNTGRFEKGLEFQNIILLRNRNLGQE